MTFELLVPLILMQAAADEPSASGAVASLRRCQAIAVDAERLRCFDAAAAALVTSVERKDVIVTDRQEIRRTKRSLFGFSLPRIGPFSQQPDERDAEGVAKLTGPLKSVGVLRGGLLRFVVEEGAVWETTEMVPFPPKVGSEATIRRAALGSYLVRFSSGRTFRARRVE